MANNFEEFINFNAIPSNFIIDDEDYNLMLKTFETVEELDQYTQDNDLHKDNCIINCRKVSFIFSFKN